jgi:hypothetical protein
MNRGAPSLWQLVEHHLAVRDNEQYLGLFREQLNQSELLTTMKHVAGTVNDKAGELLIDVQSYLPPEALVLSFTFHREGQDYVLQLESWGPRPTVVFLTRKWRSRVLVSSFGWICRLFGVEEYVIDVKYSSLFRAEQVTEADVERWFTYLISAFDRALAPSFPRDDGIPSAQRLGEQTEPVAEA